MQKNTVTRHSEKREAIYNILKDTKSHPSVDWLYRMLKPQYPDLSLGTVYRNLSQFKDDGRIITIGVVNGQERFDADTSDHSHFMCRQCGAILDVDAKVSISGIREIEDSGCKIETCRVVFHGLCSGCSEGKQKT